MTELRSQDLETVSGGSAWQTTKRIGGKIAGPLNVVMTGWAAYQAGKRQLDQGHSYPYAVGAAAVEAVNQTLWGLPAVISNQITAHPERVYNLEK